MVVQLKSIRPIVGAENSGYWGTTTDNRVIEVYPVFIHGQDDDSYLKEYSPDLDGSAFCEVIADDYNGDRVCVYAASLHSER